MNIQGLVDHCRKVIDGGGEWVILVREDGKTRLCATHGPRGELLCVNGAGKSVVRYNAKTVLRYIQKLEREQAEMN